MQDIIAAVATAPGKGGVAIVRISGRGSKELAQKLFTPWDEPKARYMYYGQMLYNGTAIDKGLAVWFETGRSFTGEETVELHCHGGERVSALVLEAAIEAGARPAQAGEFTKRAFLNGMIDLSGAEAVGDIIQADSKAAVLLAGRSLAGGLYEKVEDFRSVITDTLAAIEANIDYPDEVSEQYTRDQAKQHISTLISQLQQLISTYQYGRLHKEGISVCIMGRPNAGKSSLLNSLCGRDSAIVTPIEGTTRDVLHETVELGGIAVHLYDTAGLRESDDQIEQMGIMRARNQAKNADLVLYMVDAAVGLSKEDEQELSWLKDSGKRYELVVNKCDLADNVPLPAVRISAIDGNGVEQIRNIIIKNAGDTAEGVTITSLRHLSALKNAKGALEDALNAVEFMPLDCVSIDIHRAWDELGQITGQSVNEEIIDRIFANFCVGK